jgi:hypothetical protein
MVQQMGLIPARLIPPIEQANPAYSKTITTLPDCP